MPTCEIKAQGFCNGEDLRKVQLKTKKNVFDGAIVMACSGCRKLHNGGFKNVKEEKPESKTLPAQPGPKKTTVKSYNSSDIENWKFADQELPQEWADHLGDLPARFTIYIDGHGGSGKTDYSLQLCKVMAIYKGKTRLNNVEQGKHKQITSSARRNKFSDTIPKGKFLYTAITDFDQFVQMLKRPNSGTFIAIDSISYWPLTTKQIQFLFKTFKNKSFALIAYRAHLTRNQEIRHLCDIKINVEDYVAKVESTRFGGTKDFVIWDKKKQKAQLELAIEIPSN